MAPKRYSGGSSGGGGDGGGGFDSPWTAPIHFHGSHFTDKIARGVIIVNGILLFALFVTAMLAGTVRKSSDGNRRIVRSYTYSLSMVAALISFGINFAGSIIRDVSTSVAAIYLLIERVLENFSYFAQILLLAAVYCLVRYSYQRSSSNPLPKFVKWLHNIICTILFGLWIAIMYYSIAFEVHLILLDRNYEELENDIDLAAKIIVAYNALFLCASIEVLAWGAAIFFNSRERENNDATGALSIEVVGLPLMIFALWSLGISSALLHHNISDEILLTYLIFYKTCIVMVYGGMILIERRFENDHNDNAGGFMPPGFQANMPSNQWQSQPLMHDGNTPYYQTAASPYGFNWAPAGSPTGHPNSHPDIKSYTYPHHPPNSTSGTYWPNHGPQNEGYAPVSPEVGVHGTQPASNQKSSSGGGIITV